MASKRRQQPGAAAGEPGEHTAQATADGGKPPAYAIFEGGGAKGITHIGALQALREDYWLVGTAGASAGAIIAALAAVGYEARDLFDKDEQTDILQEYGQTPTGLIGEKAWRRIGRAKRALKPSLVLAVYLVLALAVLLATRAPWWAPLLAGSAALICLVPLATLAWPILSSGGFVSTNAMRDLLDRMLRDRLQDLYKKHGLRRKIGAYVTFADMAPETISDCCRLRIIVTDARRGRPIQFDEKTPTASVADAVAASAALPIVFTPSRIRGAGMADKDQVFVDGGLVSNLPVWAFISEKKIFERGRAGTVPIFAFTLNAPAREATASPSSDLPKPHWLRRLIGAGRRIFVGLFALLWRFAWRLAFLPFRAIRSLAGKLGPRFSILEHVRDVVSAGIFGSQTIIQDFVADLRIVEMASPLTTVEFGCDRAAATAAFQAGLDKASECLKGWQREEEEEAALLRGLLQEIGEELKKRRGHAPTGARLSIVDQTRPGYFKVTASAGMEDDADDRMEFDPSNAAAPTVFRDKVPTIAPYAPGPQSIREVMTKYEQALLRPDRKSVISVPIYKLANGFVPAALTDREVDRVLCLDSDDDLRGDFDDPKFLNWLGESAVVLGRTEGDGGESGAVQD